LARKILLADDSVTAQNMGRKILADAGYEVVTVNNGSAALKRISETKPDLIVLDVYMPGYSGLEVCQRLKESGDTARIPVVLTVGKLEPFKPEEAKRVRADGFIVKPFEASELLSALSKLEDRIVPRPEPAKPGRFARANAAIDASYDKSVANTDEDAGWKNRINFPAKKKAAEPEYAEDPAIYNPVNKDLRTTVEGKKDAPKPQEQPKDSQQAQVQEEARVDLGALAPEGLPKDVTPEEIAALAAAAAQVKGKLSEVETAAAAKAVAPSKPVDVVAESKAEEVKPAVAQDQEVEPKKAEPQSVTEPPKEAVAAVSEPVSQPGTKTTETLAEAPAIAASAELAPVATISAASNGTGSQADEPVTMAVAAGAEHSAIPMPRWKAVPVAVLAEEAALSLEEEMRKALSAVAAAEMAQPAPVTTVASALEITPVVSSAAAASAIPVEAESATTISAVASAPADAISEAVKDLEAVAASFTELHKPAAEPATEPPAAVVAPDVPAEAKKFELPAVAEPEIAKIIPAPDEPAAALSEKVVEAKAEEKEIEKSKIDEIKIDEIKPAQAEGDAPKMEELQPVASADAGALSAETVADITARVAESSKVLVEAAAATAQEVSGEPAKTAAHKAVLGGIDDMAKKESEMTEQTAAAWASWRRIRDTGDGKNGSSKDRSSKDASSKENVESKGRNEQDALDQAKAAMAVAAGAEKAPEEVAAGEDSEVSAIVDSVLADLRPKIVEEISRKLGKKK
jgi:CheY-like chemotaxis protein